MENTQYKYKMKNTKYEMQNVENYTVWSLSLSANVRLDRSGLRAISTPSPKRSFWRSGAHSRELISPRQV